MSDPANGRNGESSRNLEGSRFGSLRKNHGKFALC
jgi:hypothetical protein